MKNFIYAAAVFMFLTTGCQTIPYQGQARDVKKKPAEGGILALPLDPRDEDRAKAELKMQQNCGVGKFRILEEGEVVIGQKTNSDNREDNRANTQHKVGTFLGMPVVSGDAGGKNVSATSTTENIKEWQISYECKKK
jgi:hypothetical protein